MAPQRKFTTEFGIEIDVDLTLMMEPRGLTDASVPDGVREFAEACHLYLIGRRPRTCVVPTTVEFHDRLMKAHFINRVRSEEAIVAVEWSHDLSRPGLQLDSPWPHDVVRVVDESGTQVFRRRASSLLSEAMFQGSGGPSDREPADAQFLDLEVLYAGKSFGREGERGALSRLSRHETLQRVLAELPAEMEAWLLFLDSSRYNVLTSIIPVDTIASTDQDDAHIEEALSRPLSDAEITDLMEGCLIRYFQPTYNDRLKTTFPSPSSRVLGGAYQRDLNLISLMIDTHHLSFRLASQVVPPAFQHHPIFNFHSVDDRKSMLDFLDDLDVLRQRREGHP